MAIDWLTCAGPGLQGGLSGASITPVSPHPCVLLACEAENLVADGPGKFLLPLGRSSIGEVSRIDSGRRDPQTKELDVRTSRTKSFLI